MVFLIIFVILAIIIVIQFFGSARIANNTVIAFVGTMGSGKTFLAVREGRRAYKKQKLQHVFCKILPFLRPFFPKWKRKPYLYSNIPIKLKRFGKEKFSRVLTVDHIMRRRILPEGSIVVIDEIGQFASQWDYDNPYVKEQLADLTRFFRHWVDGRMFITDQSSDNVVKPVRARLGVIYHLNDFHRWLHITPFYKVNVTSLLMVEDSQQALTVSDDKQPYYFGILHYRWFQKLLKLNRYDSRCYSKIYREGATRSSIAYDNTLKTRYLIDIAVSKAVSKDYKDNRECYKQALYMPAPKDED